MRLAIGFAAYALFFLIVGLAVGFMFDVGAWIGRAL
jgi:hypothetical protein